MVKCSLVSLTYFSKLLDTLLHVVHVKVIIRTCALCRATMCLDKALQIENLIFIPYGARVDLGKQFISTCYFTKKLRPRQIQVIPLCNYGYLVIEIRPKSKI